MLAVKRQRGGSSNENPVPAAIKFSFSVVTLKCIRARADRFLRAGPKIRRRAGWFPLFMPAMVRLFPPGEENATTGTCVGAAAAIRVQPGRT